jgi:hypothetical protein
MAKIACQKCNSKKVYNMERGKRRCARCKYEFIPHKLPLTFSRDGWKEIVYLFLMEQSSNSIAEQTGFESSVGSRKDKEAKTYSIVSENQVLNW